eukprot:jgi/Chrzof1/8511/Cz03g13230.t1
MASQIKVQGNNVDQAWSRLNKLNKEAGLYEDLKKHRHFITTGMKKFDQTRAAYNKRVGQVIKDRLKWVIRRRKIKFDQRCDETINAASIMTNMYMQASPQL